MAFQLNLVSGIVGGIGIVALLAGFFGGRAVKKKDLMKGVGALAVVFALLVVFGAVQIGPFSTGLPSAQPSPAAVTTTTSTCGSTGVTTIYGRAPDQSSVTTSFLAGLTYLVGTDGIINPLVNPQTLGTGGWTALNSSVPCSQSYSLAVATTAGSIAGGKSAEFTVDRIGVQKEVPTYALAAAKIFVKDLTTDTRNYVGYDNIETTNSSTAFVDLNLSTVLSTADDTDTTIGTDGYIDSEVQIKCGTANKWVVAPGEELYICVDIGANNHWQEPVLSWNGKKLTSAGVKTSLSADDQNALNAYEYCYDAGSQGIGDTANTLNVYIKARSGVNPSDDPIIGFYGKGLFKSSKVDKILEGLYTDANTQVLVVASTEYTPRVTYKIA